MFPTSNLTVNTKRYFEICSIPLSDIQTVDAIASYQWVLGQIDCGVSPRVMTGAIPPLLYVCSWRARGQLYLLYLDVIQIFIPKVCSYINAQQCLI